MKIAVTHKDGEICGQFRYAEQFKIYEVNFGEITEAELVDTEEIGDGALISFLEKAQIDVLICEHVGNGVANVILDSGIQLYHGISGDADMRVREFLAGELELN